MSAAGQSLDKLRKIEKANPGADVKRAIARNDLRFKAFGGNSVVIPGVEAEDYEKYGKYAGGVDFLWFGDVVSGYEHGRLLAIARHYAQVYNELLAGHLDRIEARKFAASLAGYAALAGDIAIERVDIGDFNSLPKSMHAMLKSLRPRCADRAWWFDPLEEDKPVYDWRQFLAVYRQTDEAVCRHGWIRQWIRAGANRHAEAHILGITPRAEANFETFAKAAWRTAGLEGEPHF